MKANIETFVLVAVALVLISIRTYERLNRRGKKKLKLDDYLMILVGVRLHTILDFKFLVIYLYDLSTSYRCGSCPQRSWRPLLSPNSTV